MHRALGTIAVASLVLAGCGGGGGKGEDAKEPEVEVSDNGGSTTSTSVDRPAKQEGKQESKKAPTAASRDGVVASGGSESATASAPAQQGEAPVVPTLPPGDPAKPKVPLKAELKESCVKAGGSQTITIRSEPEAGVGYDSWYSDGKTGAMEGHYGGNNGSPVDPEGTFTDSWVIAPHAPPGTVQVNVLGSKVGFQASQVVLTFTLVAPTGSCG